MGATNKLEELDADDSIFKVDTVPPPPGDDDAYGAVTKVGALAKGAIDQMMRDADRNEVPRTTPTIPPESTVRKSRATPKPARPPTPETLEEACIDTVWVQEFDEDALEPTCVSDKAKPVAVLAVNVEPKIEFAELPRVASPANRVEVPAHVVRAVLADVDARAGFIQRPARPSVLSKEIVIGTVSFVAVAGALLVYLFG